jgi:hypothetical protein
VEGSCEHGNEPSGSIKCWEVLEWLHNWQLFRKGSARKLPAPGHISAMAIVTLKGLELPACK